MTDTYDSDDCYDRSDRLEPQIINYDPEDTVPPFLRRSSFQHGKVPPSAADQVLLDHLDPSRPDIAAYAAKNTLFPSSDDELGPSSPPKQKPKRKEEPQPPEAPPASRELAKEVLKILSRNDPPAEDGGNDALHRQDRGGHDPSPSGSIDPTPKAEPLQHVQELPPLKICLERRLFDDDISENSPLRKYAISPSLRSAQQVLPALQSPPQSTTANPPEDNNNHSLPSLQSAIGDQLSGIPLPKEPRIGGAPPYHFPIVPGSTPPLPRTDLVHERQLSGPLPPPQVPLSPFSHFSPASSTDLSNMPSPATQLPSWRNTFKPDIPHIPPTYEVPPHPSQMAQSPATGYPTPTDQTYTVPEKVAHPTGNTQSTVSVPVGTFKCDHPGCMAPPFQTQYLLNSHANVHSQDRPHFCPVPGCHRGIGGKGFKRKNEMIRHGLVHDSPGYVCPFCPNQQHKYPRPDNLQRHVKVHHPDKGKDDPELRKVLARRPAGSARGRRRRTNA